MENVAKKVKIDKKMQHFTILYRIVYRNNPRRRMMYMVKKFSKIGVCMVFVLSMILPQAAVSKAKTANPYTGKKYVYCSNYKDGIELYGKDGSKKKKYTLIKKEYSMIRRPVMYGRFR